SVLKHAIAFTRLRVEPYVVAQARASTALHAQAKAALLRRNVLFHHGRTNLLERVVRHLNALGRSGGRGFDGLRVLSILILNGLVFECLIHHSTFGLPGQTCHPERSEGSATGRKM